MILCGKDLIIVYVIWDVICNMGCNSLKLFIRIEKKMYLIDYPFVNNFMHDIFDNFSHFNSIQFYVNQWTILKCVLLISVMHFFLSSNNLEKRLNFLSFGMMVHVLYICCSHSWKRIVLCDLLYTIIFFPPNWPHMAFDYKYLVHRGTFPLSLALLLFGSWLGTGKGSQGSNPHISITDFHFNK